jgi:hypothetical protein
VGQLSEAFHLDSHAPSPSADLAGKTLLLTLEDGCTAECGFLSPERLTWSMAVATGVQGGAERSEERYLAVELREGLYLVDFLWSEMSATTVTLLLDLGQGIATALIGRLPDESEARRPFADRIAAGDELTAVSVVFLSAAIDQPFTPQTPRHRPTTDLVGRRVEYTYSPSERYEHVYLNEALYTWHCLEGSEKGLADTDRCHYLKLADELYLFAWREKIVPTLGVVAVDLAAMRTAGKILGYAGDGSMAVANFPVGARARLLSAAGC